MALGLISIIVGFTGSQHALLHAIHPASSSNSQQVQTQSTVQNISNNPAIGTIVGHVA